jgi:hypothetical protein
MRHHTRSITKVNGPKLQSFPNKAICKHIPIIFYGSRCALVVPVMKWCRTNFTRDGQLHTESSQLQHIPSVRGSLMGISNLRPSEPFYVVSHTILKSANAGRMQRHRATKDHRHTHTHTHTHKCIM